MAARKLKMNMQNDSVVMDNGILQITLTNPGGIITGIQYNGVDNILAPPDENVRGGSWDVNWSEAGASGTTGKLDSIEGTSLHVIVDNEDQIELSFTRLWNPSQSEQVPLHVDKRFVLLSGSSGFYSYAIFEHTKDLPAISVNTTRIAFSLSNEKFHYMAVADNRQRFMPRKEDRLPDRCEQLAYKEAVRLVNPVEPEFKGEVDDKYQYSLEDKDNKVHGWICFDPPIGFWQITPSNEFRTGGPFKQDLSSHVNPTTLAIFVTSHYAGEDLLLKFDHGEAWKKVYGPVFAYVNSVPDKSNATISLWEDAKKQMEKEVKSWPYSFPVSEDFPKSDQRGTCRGRLLIKDRYVSQEVLPAKSAYVGLAAPGDVGSWQRECKSYQFWTTADENGNFVIKNVHNGNFNLYASVPGFIGDHKNDAQITISSGCDIDMGELFYEPPRDGPTIWEIGIPDRSGAEFFVPDPDPKYINKLYVNHPDKFRQYGLWERYAELYPDKDLVYTVGLSDYKKDWFFAQVTRKTNEKTYESTTWQIKFKLDKVDLARNYVLRIALASAHHSELQVQLNDITSDPPLFSTGEIGGDNAIARHGIHGLYWLFNAVIEGTKLMQGENTIFLTQAKGGSPFQGIIYDYIRLEGPSS